MQDITWLCIQVNRIVPVKQLNHIMYNNSVQVEAVNKSLIDYRMGVNNN